MARLPNWIGFRLVEIVFYSAILFVPLTFVLKVLGGTFGDGVLLGTGIAIVWYTLETLDLRRETSELRREAARQNETASAQKQIALEQADRAIRPLLVMRIELVSPPGSVTYQALVVRNIGHGPALFVEVQSFMVSVWTKGAWRVAVGRVDLVEPGKVAELLLMPHGAGQVPNSLEILTSLQEDTGRATAISDIVIVYEDVQKRRFESVMQMGINGTRLLRHRPL